jgi:hypothetical protein
MEKAASRYNFRYTVVSHLSAGLLYVKELVNRGELEPPTR